MSDIQRAAVVGAGTMGHGFAQVFALGGLAVSLIDRTEELLAKGREWIQASLEFMIEIGEVDRAGAAEALSRINLQTDLAAGLAGAEYVLEAVTENLELKLDLFRRLGELTGPEVILASNTSSYDVNLLAEAARHPGRVIGTHWFHPPQITPGVEVVPARATRPEVVARATALMRRVGKFPTPCVSAPGFVANRIQMALAAESLAIVAEGLATPEEVDRIVKSTFGFRLSAYGPFEIMDQAGPDVYRAVFDYLHRELGQERFRPSPLLTELVDQGRLGIKTGAGFYDYPGDRAQALRRERDGRLWPRLGLFRREQGIAEPRKK